MYPQKYLMVCLYKGESHFLRLQGIKVYRRLVFGVFEDLKFKTSEGSDQN